MQFIDHRRFADTRVAGDQHQFRHATADNAIESADQRVDLTLPPVELFGNQQPVGRVVFAQRENIDAALALPVCEAVLQIMLDASSRLVSLLGRLGKQLHDDVGERGRHGVHACARRHRLSGDVTVHPLHWVGGLERQRAGQHLVERDAESIEVAA